MIEITAESLRGLKEEAKHCRRKRKNLNYHPKMDDPINRMVHAMNPGTYIPISMRILIKGRYSLFSRVGWL